MAASVRADLDRLAGEDAVVAPLAALQATALEAAEEPGWDDGVPALGENRLAAGIPLLDGLTLAVDADRQRGLLRRLADVLAQRAVAEADRLRSVLRSESCDPLALLAASLTQDGEAIERLATGAGVEAGLLAVVAHAASLPLLLACGRRAEPLVRSAGWSEGFCPVCASWPTLAEVRGLAREYVLRCGRCASAWKGEQGRCAFCGNQDHQTLGYLAAEQERESRRAAVCDGCHAYLKAVTSLGALGPADLLLHDLRTLELDVAALEQEYVRPDGLGCELVVAVAPAEPTTEPPTNGQRGNGQHGERRGWRRWLG
jgi:FdhE protein